MKSNYKNIDEANKKIDSIIKQFEICKEKIQKENKEQNKIINDYRNQNFELREDLGFYKNKYIELNDENKKIKHFFTHDELDFLNEITELKERISNLVRTNTNLQNDLFSEQLLQDETDDYIDRLKNQLFNAYLEIESDNVNIQLSHYHIKKLLKIIDEHTLINPYTN
ncbi:MAG: hypothetical protein ACTIJD_11605 [Staphylococcus saprophyticus]